MIKSSLYFCRVTITAVWLLLLVGLCWMTPMMKWQKTRIAARGKKIVFIFFISFTDGHRMLGISSAFCALLLLWSRAGLTFWVEMWGKMTEMQNQQSFSMLEQCQEQVFMSAPVWWLFVAWWQFAMNQHDAYADIQAAVAGWLRVEITRNFDFNAFFSLHSVVVFYIFYFRQFWISLQRTTRMA